MICLKLIGPYIKLFFHRVNLLVHFLCDMRLKHTLQSYQILEIDKFMFALPPFFTRPFIDGNDCKYRGGGGELSNNLEELGKILGKPRKRAVFEPSQKKGAAGKFKFELLFLSSPGKRSLS